MGDGQVRAQMGPRSRGGATTLLTLIAEEHRGDEARNFSGVGVPAARGYRLGVILKDTVSFPAEPVRPIGVLPLEH